MAAVTVWLYVLITFIATKIVNFLTDQWREQRSDRTIDPGWTSITSFGYKNVVPDPRRC